MSRRHLATLLVLSAIWGASFMFIKVGVRELSPSALVFLRFVLAALTLAAILPLRLPLGAAGRAARAAALPLVLMAFVNSALPIWLISWAEQRIDSGLTAILQAGAPLFTALLALRFSAHERVSGARLVGLVVGFVGVAVLVGGVRGDRRDVVAALAVVAAGFLYACGALYSSNRLRETPPLVVALGTMVVATLMLAPFGLADLPGGVPGWKVTGSVLALGIVGTGLAYVLYFELISGAGASRAVLVTYLVPALALVYGATLLDEPLTAPALAGLALVLGGVALGTGSLRLRREPAPAPAEEPLAR